MELLPGGDFLHFLHKHGTNQTISQLTKYVLDAALGMEYLALKNCIHHDLAARNCSIRVNNEVLKISDFVMSKEANKDYIYLWPSDCEPIPVKWTAPEVTTMLYHNNHNYIPFVHETVSQTGHQECFVFLFSWNYHGCFCTLKCQIHNYVLIIDQYLWIVVSWTRRYVIIVLGTAFKPGMWQACTWFLEITFVSASCACVCLFPKALITSGVIWCDIDLVWLVKQVLWLFHFLFVLYGTFHQ